MITHMIKTGNTMSLYFTAQTMEDATLLLELGCNTAREAPITWVAFDPHQVNETCAKVQGGLRVRLRKEKRRQFSNRDGGSR